MLEKMDLAFVNVFDAQTAAEMLRAYLVHERKDESDEWEKVLFMVDTILEELTKASKCFD